MTYRELLGELQKLSSEDLDKTVTIYDYERDEYLPHADFTYTVEGDYMGDGYPILTI